MSRGCATAASLIPAIRPIARTLRAVRVFPIAFSTSSGLFPKLKSFDPAAPLVAQASLSAYAESSVAWLSAGRKGASEQADQQGVVRDRTQLALSNATGGNLDDEMSRLLDLEHAYQVSAKLIATIDDLYQTLFQAVSP